MRLRSIGLLTGLLIFLACRMSGQAPARLQEVARLEGGAAVALAGHGDYVYAGCGHELWVLDTRSPNSPPVWTKRLKAPVQNLRVHRGFLYVAANHAGLQRFDLADPARPQISGEYMPAGPRESALDVAFAGDTVLAVMGVEVAVLRIKAGINSGFEKIAAFAEQIQEKGRISGGVVHGGYFAALIGGREKGLGDGVHMFNLRNYQRTGFHQQRIGMPQSALFGNNGKLLHVAGGNASGGRGIYYVLDLEDIAHPQLAFCDTLRGPESEVCARSLVLHHDTVLVLAQRAWNVIDCLGPESYAWAYSAKSAGSVKRIGTLPFKYPPWAATLVHGEMIVAEGHGGIVVHPWPRNFQMNCDTANEKTWKETGSFMYAADAFGERIAVALGDNGIALYTRAGATLKLIKAYVEPGRCTNLKFSGTGTHLIAFFACPLGDSIRVLDANTLEQVGSYSGRLGHEQVRMWQDRFFVMLPDGVGFEVIDLRDPKHPKRERGVLMTLNAMAMDNLGHLILSSEHSLKVMDVNAGAFRDVGRISHWGEGFGVAGGLDGTLFVHSRERGLLRYRLAGEGSALALVEEGFEVLPFKHVAALSVDKQGVYLADDGFGVAVADARQLKVKGQWGGPSGLGLQAGTGIRELFCWGGHVYVVDFVGGLSMILDGIGK